MIENYGNKLIQISLAAKWFDVPQKTIHNWIKTGLLSMPEPGKVRRAEVEAVYKNQILKQAVTARMSLLGIGRDEKGRFIDLPKDPI
jgi:hypothetical protein